MELTQHYNLLTLLSAYTAYIAYIACKHCLYCVWQGLRCCEELTAICQQNSDAL